MRLPIRHISGRREKEDAVRIFKAVPEADEACGSLYDLICKQQPEDHLEAVRISEAGRAGEHDLCGHAVYHGAVPEGGKLYHRRYRGLYGQPEYALFREEYGL